MKYFVRVSIVLLIAVGIVFGFSYYYREKKNNENIVLTTQVITTTKPNQTTTAAPDTVYYDDNGFKLFIDNKNKAYIEYNSVRKELGGFDWVLTQNLWIFIMVIMTAIMKKNFLFYIVLRKRFKQFTYHCR